MNKTEHTRGCSPIWNRAMDDAVKDAIKNGCDNIEMVVGYCKGIVEKHGAVFDGRAVPIDENYIRNQYLQWCNGAESSRDNKDGL